MIDIPRFDTPTDQDLYTDLFDDKLTAYAAMMDKVKDVLYGPGFGNYSNLPGTCFQVLEKITTDLVDATTHDYVLTKKNKVGWANPESSLAKNYTLGDK